MNQQVLMTKDDIIKLYEKANGWSPEGWDKTVNELERFANLVASFEREECAKVCENIKDESGVNDDGSTWLRRTTKTDCAAAIRARGQE